MLALDIRRPALAFVKRLPPKHAAQIGQKLHVLLAEPYPPDSKRLAGFQPVMHRVDVGEYRIVYAVMGDTLFIPLVGKRNDGEVYRRLQRLLK